jgi:hypothetical protein
LALLQTFLLLGLDALRCTAEVKPGQKRVRFHCEQDPTRRLEWDLAPPPYEPTRRRQQDPTRRLEWDLAAPPA